MSDGTGVDIEDGNLIPKAKPFGVHYKSYAVEARAGHSGIKVTVRARNTNDPCAEAAFSYWLDADDDPPRVGGVVFVDPLYVLAAPPDAPDPS